MRVDGAAMLRVPALAARCEGSAPAVCVPFQVVDPEHKNLSLSELPLPQMHHAEPVQDVLSLQCLHSVCMKA